MISIKYMRSLSNKRLSEKLLREDNISPLEEILEGEISKLDLLEHQKQEGKLDFGPRIESSEVLDHFSIIKQEVNDFLGLDPETGSDTKAEYFSLSSGDGRIVPACYALSLALMDVVSFAISGFIHYAMSRSHFSPFTRKSVLSEKQEALFYPVAAHEYTHSLQPQSLLTLFGDRGLTEGQARGVERHIAQTYADRTGNNASLYDVTKRVVDELKESYSWVTRELEVRPRDELLKSKGLMGWIEANHRKNISHPSSYALGVALFMLYERELGSGIYQDMQHGRFALDKPPSKCSNPIT